MARLPDPYPSTVLEALRAVDAYLNELQARVVDAQRDDRLHLRATLTAAAKRDLADAQRHKRMILERIK